MKAARLIANLLLPKSSQGLNI
ncbi:hypothetical protein Gohar_019251 [Gossypium harknessii]|uniref:Uncharacterized protein n=1 Tax=Gossypium harknessii TaxID=34285 RepID=A0A7J9GBW6_9ROSI|nr:hypothetical protein [Gossypium harknessii]